MYTKQSAIELSLAFLQDLKNAGYNPRQAYLFGSYAKGTQLELSDIDIAVWDDKFTGCLPIDWQPIKKILFEYTYLEPHTYHSSHDENYNPFIEVIKKQGIQIL